MVYSIIDPGVRRFRIRSIEKTKLLLVLSSMIGTPGSSVVPSQSTSIIPLSRLGKGGQETLSIAGHSGGTRSILELIVRVYGSCMGRSCISPCSLFPRGRSRKSSCSPESWCHDHVVLSATINCDTWIPSQPREPRGQTFSSSLTHYGHKGLTTHYTVW